MNESSIDISTLILYKDQQILVMQKPAGMPVQPDKTSDLSLQQLAASYCKHRVWLVNRLDRPVSGCVVFAKNARAAAFLQEQWQEGEVEKIYLAVCGKKEDLPETGEWQHRLEADPRHNKTRLVTGEEGQICRLQYRRLAVLDRYQLLELKPVTGRFHQIRAQLAAEGMPVKGDVKYGDRRGNPDRSICLHSWKISFPHPTKGERVSCEAPLPEGGVWQAVREALKETE